MRNLRVILAGKHELACLLFEKLLGSQHECAFVTCKTEPEIGPRRYLKNSLAEHGLSPLNAHYTHQTLFQCVNDYKADVILSAGFDKIIRPEVFGSARHCVNVHFGRLPRYRGNHSIPYAILNGDQEVGVSLHYVDAGIDSGDVIAQVSVPVAATSNAREVYEDCVKVGARMAMEFLEKVSAGQKIHATKQDESQATYFGPQFVNGYQINWKQTGRWIADYIRAAHFPPLKPAFSMLESETVYFHSPVAVVYPSTLSAEVGQIVEYEGAFGVRVLNGLVLPGEVTVEGESQSFTTWVRRSENGARKFVVPSGAIW